MDATDDPIEEKLRTFAGLVAASPHNLVSRAARDELLTRHVPESMAVARLLPRGGGRLLDVGSGGGFPGMVIAMARPEFDVHLLDSTRKKTEFLEQAAVRLDVELTVHTGRAEELGVPPLAASFDIVTARAVAPLSRLLPWTLPFLRDGGMLYAVKGDRWRQEIDEAGPILERVGAQVVATPDDLPKAANGDEAHHPRVVMIGQFT